MLKWLALQDRQSGYLVSVYFEYAWHCHGPPALAQNGDDHGYPHDCDDHNSEDDDVGWYISTLNMHVS